MSKGTTKSTEAAVTEHSERDSRDHEEKEDGRLLWVLSCIDSFICLTAGKKSKRKQLEEAERICERRDRNGLRNQFDTTVGNIIMHNIIMHKSLSERVTEPI